MPSRPPRGSRGRMPPRSGCSGTAHALVTARTPDFTACCSPTGASLTSCRGFMWLEAITRGHPRPAGVPVPHTRRHLGPQRVSRKDTEHGDKASLGTRIAPSPGRDVGEGNCQLHSIISLSKVLCAARAAASFIAGKSILLLCTLLVLRR